MILTLRSDFLDRTQAYPGLNDLISKNGLFVPPMAEAELRLAIAEPARQSGYPLPPLVVDLLLEQARGHGGVLPLLQFALVRIWEGLTRGEDPAKLLADMGGVGGALAATAQNIFADLSESDQNLMKIIFVRLVHVVEGLPETRRRVTLADLVIQGEQPEKIRSLLHRFAQPDARLLSFSGQDGAEWVEFVHEALFHGWPEMRQWLDERRHNIPRQRRLEEAAKHWEENKRDQGLLWRTTDLQLLWGLYQISATEFSRREIDFYIACNRLYQYSRLRRFIFISIFFVSIFILSMGSYLYIYAENKARQDAERAYRAESQARQDAERAYRAESQARQDAERAYRAESQARQDAERAIQAESQVQQEAIRASQAETIAQQEMSRAKRVELFLDSCLKAFINQLIEASREKSALSIAEQKNEIESSEEATQPVVELNNETESPEESAQPYVIYR
ncbi:MAG: hypothetical protein H7833_17365 [Magnetococcus sp. DMHC-1]